MAGEFLASLRAANLFGRPRPLGMPDTDEESIAQMMGTAMARANEMKNQDLRRQKELMEFQRSLQMRGQPLPAGAPTGMVPPKKNIVYGGVEPLNSTQREFAIDRGEERAQRARLGLLGAQQAGALNNSLSIGKQRSEADMQRLTTEINARKEEGAAGRASAERIAESRNKAAMEQRQFTARENEKARTDKGWQSFNIDDPNDPTKKIAVRMNLATGEMERARLDEKDVAGLLKPGTKTGTSGGADTAPMIAIKEKAQETLDELSNLIDDKDELTEEGKAITSVSGAATKHLPYTDARSGSNTLNRVKAMHVINLIGQMKAQSKTGATGFGALNLRELGVLESAASKLDPYDKNFSTELKRVKSLLNKILQNPEAKTDRPASNKPVPGQNLDVEAYMRKYGGR